MSDELQTKSRRRFAPLIGFSVTFIALAMGGADPFTPTHYESALYMTLLIFGATAMFAAVDVIPQVRRWLE